MLQVLLKFVDQFIYYGFVRSFRKFSGGQFCLFCNMVRSLSGRVVKGLGLGLVLVIKLVVCVSLGRSEQ